MQQASTPAGHGSIRVHGTWKTVPIDTRTDAAVERVGAARRDQHGVDPEGARPTEDRADVRVVDHVLEDRHPPGAARRARRTGGRTGRCIDAKRPAVQVEPGHLLEDIVLADEHRHAVRLGLATRSASSVSQRRAMR